MSVDHQIARAEARVENAKETIAALLREPDRAYAASCFAQAELQEARTELKNAKAALYALRMQVPQTKTGWRIGYCAG